MDLIHAHPNNSYEGIGISLPGRIDASLQRLIFSPALGWSDVDLKTPIERAIGLPVELENAANACALAELWSGHHANESSNLLAVTVSDGIGVGMIMNGQLVRGSKGVAGRIWPCSSSAGRPPSVFAVIAAAGKCWRPNAAAVRYYAESVSVRKGEVGSKSAMATVPFTAILQLAAQGDPKACKALNQMAHHLGIGIAMLVTGLAPDVVVVVGEVTRAWDMVGPIVNEAVKSRSFTHAATRILATDPEAQPRLRGTIALVLQKTFRSPNYCMNNNQHKACLIDYFVRRTN
ncbi:MAG: ROK family protein [Limisphaerales bacterium]